MSVAYRLALIWIVAGDTAPATQTEQLRSRSVSVTVNIVLR